MIVGPDGAAWVTDGGQNAIVRVDNDHKVTVFKLPIKDYTNLNTAAFDKTGIYWFTGQSGYHGRLDPKSGDIAGVQVAGRTRQLRHDRHAARATSGTPRSPAATSPRSI